jgi:hypothetical protein
VCSLNWGPIHGPWLQNWKAPRINEVNLQFTRIFHIHWLILWILSRIIIKMKRENSQWFCWQFLGRRFYNESKLLIIKDFRFIICQFFCRSKFLECPNFFRLTAKKKRKSMCKHYIFLLCTVQHVTIVYLFTNRVSDYTGLSFFCPTPYVHCWSPLTSPVCYC